MVEAGYDPRQSGLGLMLLTTTLTVSCLTMRSQTGFERLGEGRGLQPLLLHNRNRCRFLSTSPVPSSIPRLPLFSISTEGGYYKDCSHSTDKKTEARRGRVMSTVTARTENVELWDSRPHSIPSSTLTVCACHPLPALVVRGVLGGQRPHHIFFLLEADGGQEK